jgi:hypothetical protein
LAYTRRAVADPHVLYLIVGADILGLIVWVVFVLVRAPVREAYLPDPPVAAPKAEAPPPVEKGEPVAEATPATEAKAEQAPEAQARRQLRSYSDIADDPPKEGEGG